MNLNRKGYMLVEIVIASVLAMTIAYYLLNLTYKFKNTNQDIHESYYFMNDKLLITKNIMTDLEKCQVLATTEINTEETKTINLTLISTKTTESQTEQRRLEITKTVSSTIIEYGKIENGIFNTNDVSYYKKELVPSLIVDDLIKNEDENSLTITIPIQSIYDDNDYSIKLFVSKSTST